MILGHRLSVLKLSSFAHYLKHLQSFEGAEELTYLIGTLTVSETYFFRNTAHWDAFRTFVIPSLIALKHNRDKTLRIWSAGCSTGEEPYTIAILLKEYFPVLWNWTIDIWATDINPESIMKARHGNYTKNAFRGGYTHLIDTYFDYTRKRYQIKPELKAAIRFETFNLVSIEDIVPRPACFDVIFCRNVLMYFQADHITRIIRSIAASLRQNGFLFVGHAEGSFVQKTSLKALNVSETYVYKQTSPCLVPPPKVTATKLSGIATNRSNEPEHRNAFIASRVSIKKNGSSTQAHDSIGQASSGIETIDDMAQSYKDAVALYFQHKFKTALALPVIKAAEQRSNLNLLILKTLLYIEISELEKAESCLHVATKCSDISPELYLVEALIRESQGDYDSTIIACRAAIFLDTLFFAPNFVLGRIYAIKGDMIQKRKYYGIAGTLLEKDDDLRIRLFFGGASKVLLTDICLHESRE